MLLSAVAVDVDVVVVVGGGRGLWRGIQRASILSVLVGDGVLPSGG